MKKLNNGSYYCPTCKTTYILDESDGIIMAYNANGDKLGIISVTPDIYDDISHSCPICNGWEDGNGNSCNADGWGTEEE